MERIRCNNETSWILNQPYFISKDECFTLYLGDTIGILPEIKHKRIKEQWDIDVKVDKSSRQLDFAVNNNGKLFFIECNFYGGGGSKLKSTATEYIEMNRYWNKQGIEFIWITDGAGWKSTMKPLGEYFDKADYLLNLEMLKDKILTQILKQYE
ncbi:MAG: DpnII family type II restriction endonuclease [Bacteroidota bacterium]